jgi:mono/diheme cytochrome c family protein
MRRGAGAPAAILVAAALLSAERAGAQPQDPSVVRVGPMIVVETGFDEESLPVELRWLAPGADPVAALTTEPVECLAPAATADEARRQEIGRVLFRTPTLLGGQAARAGLSCAACHRNGRSNPDFAFVGVSGAPGTADVTSSFFSSHRGDGVDNPVPIPDLAGPHALLKVDRDRESRALEAFIRGLIVEEFDGPEPPAAALQSLAAYVRGLAPEACPAEPVSPVAVAGRLTDAQDAVRLARETLRDGDAPTAGLLIAAARTDLERIHQRYAGEDLSRLREGLILSSSLLQLAQRGIEEGEVHSAESTLNEWALLFDDLAQDLEAQKSASLFNPDVLSRTLAEQR